MDATTMNCADIPQSTRWRRQTRRVANWRMRVYSPKGNLDGKHERLEAAIPTIAGRGRSLGVGDFIDIDIDADSHADAVKLVRQAVEAVLDNDDVDRIIDADHTMQDRQTMLWVIATRRQVRRWEIVLARWLKAKSDRTADPGNIWLAQIEWHMALVAANNLVRAVANTRGRVAAIPEDLAIDIRTHRDLLEHWDEQSPAFYNKASPGPLERSGKHFANRHPGGDPYWWLSWSRESGPSLGPELGVEVLHLELDRIQEEILESNPDLEQYLSPIDDTPWLRDELGRWSPK